MPNNVYYVFDDKLCKYEGMTKEQIYNAIAEATGATPVDVDEGFISTIVETHNNVSLHFWKGTSAEYAALPSHDPNTYYIISDDTTLDDIQAQIDDLTERIDNLVSTIYWCEYNVTTNADIQAALNNGRIPCVVYANRIYIYYNTVASTHNFCRSYGGREWYVMCNSSNSWSNTSLKLQLSILNEQLSLTSSGWSSGSQTISNLSFDPTQYSAVILYPDSSDPAYITTGQVFISGMSSSSITIAANATASGNHKVRVLLIP